jgi:hypothetical protein
VIDKVHGTVKGTAHVTVQAARAESGDLDGNGQPDLVIAKASSDDASGLLIQGAMPVHQRRELFRGRQGAARGEPRA